MSKLRIHPALRARLIEVGGIAGQKIRNRQGSNDLGSSFQARKQTGKYHSTRQVGLRRGARSDSAGKAETSSQQQQHTHSLHSLPKTYSLTFAVSGLIPDSLGALAWWLPGTTTYFFVILLSKTQSLRNAQSGGCQLPAGFRRPLRSQRCKC
jgi:hypothetical protein